MLAFLWEILARPHSAPVWVVRPRLATASGESLGVVAGSEERDSMIVSATVTTESFSTKETCRGVRLDESHCMCGDGGEESSWWAVLTTGLAASCATPAASRFT